MTAITYKLDPTHIGLRLTLLGVFFVSFAVALIVSIPLVNNTLQVPVPFNVLAILAITGGVSLGLSWATEKFLSPRWPSGRSLLVTHEGITLQERSGTVASIAWDQRINVLTWHFIIRKGRAWVSKGWYCTACHLRQDETTIIAYAFIKPEIAHSIPRWRAFEELLPRKASEKNRKEHPLSDIGDQAQLRYAEQDRWQIGAEMAADDFIRLITELQQRIPDWTPTG